MKVSVLPGVLFPFLMADSASGACQKVTVQAQFNLDEYISAPWYVQEQAVVDYLPIENFYCVNAEYRKVKNWFFDRTFWGYTIRVHNRAQDAEGNGSGGDLCAYQRSKDEPAKLAVAPCFLPRFFAGDYWVVAYEEGENGYALISGGQPKIENEDGTCRTGDGINNSGLWVFTRQPERNETLVSQVRDIASSQGFDLSVLNPVDQINCNYGGNRRLDQNLRG